jgi:glycosyltransferase involved in cell wall biosynthesis
LLDDWLEPLGVTLEDFCGSMMGSWLFNYVSALRTIGIDSVIIATARVPRPARRLHAPTGTSTWILPPTQLSTYLLLIADHLPVSRRIRRRIRLLLLDLLATPGRRIAAILRRERCDTLVVQDYETTRFDVCALIGRQLSIPVIGTFTGSTPQSRWHSLIRRVSLRCSAGLVICAQSELDRVHREYKVPHRKLLKLYYPLDRSVWYQEDRATVREALGLRLDVTIAIYHGAIDMNVKGLDILLDSWERVVGARPDPRFQLLILGSGKDAELLADRLQGRRDVLFRNEWIHDCSLLRRYLSAADLYVFPTRFDAFGIAVTEAMACGLPVVAGRGRGIADILPAGEHSGGLVVAAGDVEAFAAALSRLLQDRQFRLRIAACALERVADPSFGLFVAHTLERFVSAASAA